MHRYSATHRARLGGGLRHTTGTLLGRVDLVFMPELNSIAPVTLHKNKKQNKNKTPLLYEKE